MYWQYHDYMYANQGYENDGWTNANNLKILVVGINDLNTDLFSKCLDSGKYEKKVNGNTKFAKQASTRSTPSFIIFGHSGESIRIVGTSII